MVLLPPFHPSIQALTHVDLSNNFLDEAAGMVIARALATNKKARLAATATAWGTSL